MNKETKIGLYILIGWLILAGAACAIHWAVGVAMVGALFLVAAWGASMRDE